MPVYNYAFGNGANAIQGYGDRWQIQFGGTWLLFEKWGITLVTTAGDFDVGSINFFSSSVVPDVCFVFRNRVYIAGSTQFNYSDNGDPLGWEQQNPGAGDTPYLSYFGGQDVIYAFAQLQGFLLVIARRSVQIWTTDADPANFAFQQEMDNIGTRAPLSAQNLGDLDVIILDDTGFRSLRTREVTKNAYVDDLGVPVDSLVQADLRSVSASTCVGIVDPATKNYWGYLNGKIYVLARYPSGKIQAWSTYLPQYEAYATVNPGSNYVASVLTATVVKDSIYKWTPGAHEVSLVNGTETLTAAGYFKAQGTSVTINGSGATVTYTGLLQLVTLTTFTPQKFIIVNGQVYTRCSGGEILVFGGTDNNTYDTSVVTVQFPYLDFKEPSREKQHMGIDVAITGKWNAQVSGDPFSQTFENALIDYGSKTAPSELTDSTFDMGRIGAMFQGTHIGLKMFTSADMGGEATIGMVVYKYKLGART